MQNFQRGYIKNPADERDLVYAEVFREIEAVAIPQYTDYEIAMQRVRSQGSKGSCVAFACCAVKEFQEDNQHTLWPRRITLSPDMLYHIIAEEGGGAFPRNAMKALQKVGVGREKHWPYDRKEGDPKGSRYIVNWRERRRALGDARKWRIGEYAVLKTFNDIKMALVNTGPIVVGMNWNSAWFSGLDYINSINAYPLMQPSGESVGGHMFCVNGYTINNGKVYYKVRNSWGEHWGRNGHAYISEEALKWGGFRAWAMYDRIIT